MTSDWLKHFRDNRVNSGRPAGKGWLTIPEMASQAGVNVQQIRRYIHGHEKDYEKKLGTFQSSTGERNILYYRLASSKVLRASEKGNR